MGRVNSLPTYIVLKSKCIPEPNPKYGWQPRYVRKIENEINAREYLQRLQKLHKQSNDLSVYTANKKPFKS